MPEENARPAPGSSLGRYAPPADDQPLVTVRLLNLPVQLFAAAREHHDGLLREFRLVALSGRLGAQPVPPRLVELTRILGETYASAAPRAEEVFEAAIERGDLSIDVEERVPPAAGRAIAAINALMSEADELCAAEQLMTMPRGPELRRFGNWYCDQFVRQIDGDPPQPWDGPVTLGGV